MVLWMLFRSPATQSVPTWVVNPVSFNPDAGFWWPKIEGKNTTEIFFQIFFWTKLQFTSLGLHIGRPCYRRKPSALKREHPVLQKMKFITFFSIFVGHFCPFGSGSILRMRIRIRMKGHNWIRIHNTGTKPSLFPSISASPGRKLWILINDVPGTMTLSRYLCSLNVHCTV